MTRFFVFLIFSVFSFNLLYGQINNLQEIENSLSAADTLPPKERNKVYHKTIISLMHSDTKKAIKYSWVGLVRSQKERDTVAMAAFANFLGVGYWMNAQIDSSIFILRKSILWAKSVGDERRAALSYFALANTFSKTEMLDSAVGCFYAVLPYFEKQNDNKSLGAVRVNIAALYYNMGQHEKAKQFYTDALVYADKANDPTLYGNTYKGIGLYESDFDRKIDYYSKALSSFRKAGNRFEESTTLATIGWEYYIGKANTSKALSYLSQAINIAEKSEFSTLISDQSSQLTEIYLSIKDIKKAEYYALKAEAYSDKDNQILMQRLEDKLLRLYILKGDVDKATNLYKSHIEKITKQNEDRMLNALSEREVKYETEKKEFRITTLEEERKFIIILSVFGGILLILAIVVIAARQKVISQKRKIAEQKIAQLEQEKQLVATRAILEGETIERARLSKDLHDGLGGLLSVTKHKIANMKGSLTIPEEQVETFNSALEMLDNSIKELRRVAHNLMPESLMRYGLSSAINDFCGSIDKVVYHFYGVEKRVDEKLEVAAFRIVSELVNNALKHANASKINVQLVQEQDRISITVQDDGCGFDPKTIDRSKSGGLNNIESRVVSFNGRIDIFSAPEKGTEVSVEFKC